MLPCKVTFFNSKLCCLFWGGHFKVWDVRKFTTRRQIWSEWNMSELKVGSVDFSTVWLWAHTSTTSIKNSVVARLESRRYANHLIECTQIKHLDYSKWTKSCRREVTWTDSFIRQFHWCQPASLATPHGPVWGNQILVTDSSSCYCAWSVYHL